MYDLVSFNEFTVESSKKLQVTRTRDTLEQFEPLSVSQTSTATNDIDAIKIAIKDKKGFTAKLKANRVTPYQLFFFLIKG